MSDSHDAAEKRAAALAGWNEALEAAARAVERHDSAKLTQLHAKLIRGLKRPEAALEARVEKLEALKAERDAGAKDYCALMEERDAEFVRAEAAEARVRELEAERDDARERARMNSAMGEGYTLLMERVKADQKLIAEAREKVLQARYAARNYDRTTADLILSALVIDLATGD
jgi:hypothetical protein